MLFQPDFAGLIWHGLKTQTRRPRKSAKSPYGYAGDIIWVREKWVMSTQDYPLLPRLRASTGTLHYNRWIYYAADFDFEADFKWRPSIHMPRRYCRQLMALTRVEAVQVSKIDDEDAQAEGFQSRSVFLALWNEIYPGIDDCWVYEWDRPHHTKLI